jgi:hypothetical protein
MKNLKLHLAYVAIILAIVTAPAFGAVLTFTVPNNIAAEIVTGMRGRGYAQLAGEADSEYVRRITRDQFWRPIVDEARRKAARDAAAVTAAGDFGN